MLVPLKSDSERGSLKTLDDFGYRSHKDKVRILCETFRRGSVEKKTHNILDVKSSGKHVRRITNVSLKGIHEKQ